MRDERWIELDVSFAVSQETFDEARALYVKHGESSAIWLEFLSDLILGEFHAAASPNEDSTKGDWGL